MTSQEAKQRLKENSPMPSPKTRDLHPKISAALLLLVVAMLALTYYCVTQIRHARDEALVEIRQEVEIQKEQIRELKQRDGVMF